jgi:glutaminyl-peptide cyclotransferase
VLLPGCGNDKEKVSTATKDPLTINYEVRTQWLHDKDAFIEGLVIHNGKLFESTGQEGRSWIGIVDINTGKLDKKITLSNEYFGEGITILNNKIYQLTYKHKIGFIYDLDSFKKIAEFPYDSPEGWGLTHDTKNLIMSDGTDQLTFLDTTSLKTVRKLKVVDDSGPVTRLNELEFVEGFIFANIWESNIIVKIDPQSGKVVGKLDLTALSRDAKMRDPNSEVLNGIAYHPTTKLLLVTGKNWPMIYVLHLKK